MAQRFSLVEAGPLLLGRKVPAARELDGLTEVLRGQDGHACREIGRAHV